MSASATTANDRQCPRCRTISRREAAVCGHCGHRFPPVAPPATTEAEAETRDSFGAVMPPPAAATKTCPWCAETILAAAVRCRHCRSDVVSPSGEGMRTPGEPGRSGAAPDVPELDAVPTAVPASVAAPPRTTDTAPSAAAPAPGSDASACAPAECFELPHAGRGHRTRRSQWRASTALGVLTCLVLLGGLLSSTGRKALRAHPAAVPEWAEGPGMDSVKTPDGGAASSVPESQADPPRPPAAVGASDFAIARELYHQAACEVPPYRSSNCWERHCGPVPCHCAEYTTAAHANQPSCRRR